MRSAKFQGRMKTLVFLGWVLTVAGWAQDGRPARSPISTHLADYDAEPRGVDHRVDVRMLARQLKDLGANTYYWLIWHEDTDWDDLKLFLPLAAENNLAVWVYLVPPTESPPQYGKHYSEPFRLDYLRWAEEIARLSLQHTNLTGWVIDDFYANHKFFNPGYVRDMQHRAKSLNPQLAFLPLMYFNEIRPAFVRDYREVIDGVVVAYPRNREEIDRAWAILNDAPFDSPFSLGFPWEKASAPGDFIAASQAIKLTSKAAVLHFRERDDFTGTTSGYHFKQVLVNDEVVWEEDVSGGKNDWRDVSIALSSATTEQPEARLSFRLMDKRGVSNFGVTWELSDLKGEGINLSGFAERSKSWSIAKKGAFEAAREPDVYVPGRRFHIPFIAMTAAQESEFRLRHGDPASPERMAEWVQMCLQAQRAGKCDGVVTYCLGLEPGNRTFILMREAFGEYKSTLR